MTDRPRPDDRARPRHLTWIRAGDGRRDDEVAGACACLRPRRQVSGGGRMPGRSLVRFGTGTVAAPLVDWSELSEHAPDGLAVVDADGLFVQLNAAASALLS